LRTFHYISAFTPWLGMNHTAVNNKYSCPC